MIELVSVHMINLLTVYLKLANFDLCSLLVNINESFMKKFQCTLLNGFSCKVSTMTQYENTKYY